LAAKLAKVETNQPRLRNLAKVLGMGPSRLKAYAYSAADSLQQVLLMEAKSMRPSRINIVLDSIDFSLTKQSSDMFVPPAGDNGGKKRTVGVDVKYLKNPFCEFVNNDVALRQFIDAIKADKKLLDTLLSGYNFAETIQNIFNKLAMPPAMRSFKTLVDIGLNTKCGIVNYAETGEASECPQIDEPPKREIPAQFSDANQYVGACETIPEFPSFAWNLGFKMPSEL